MALNGLRMSRESGRRTIDNWVAEIRYFTKPPATLRLNRVSDLNSILEKDHEYSSITSITLKRLT